MNVVLGHHPGYLTPATKLSAQRFSVPGARWGAMTPTQRWQANRNFLAGVIRRGDQMVFSHHPLRASPDISSRAAMIAQDFARVRVLGAFSRGARGVPPRKKTAARGVPPRKRRDGSIATPYGVATMCTHAGKSAPQAAPSAPPVARPHRARARPAQFVSGRIFEICDSPIGTKRHLSIQQAAWWNIRARLGSSFFRELLYLQSRGVRIFPTQHAFVP